jgi:MtaA/CmuA family methyltransferase
MKPLGNLIYPINALPARQMVKAGIDELCWNADLKFEAVRRYYEQVDADVLFFFSDIVIQAEAMGASVSFSPDAMPSVRGPARTVALPDPSRVPRMKVNSDVLKRMSRVFPSKIIAGIVYGPCTVAGQVYGEQTLLRGILEEPHEVLHILEKAAAFTQDYARYLLDSGADLLWISDPLAALLPPDNFWRFAGEFLARVFSIHPSRDTVLHICGDTTRILEHMIQTGAGGISLDQCMNLLAVEDGLPDTVRIIGNVDPVEVLEMGSPDEVASVVEDLVGVMGLKENFTLSTGCGIPPSTPLANVIRFVESGRESFARIAPHAAELSRLTGKVYQGERDAVSTLIDSALKEGVEPLMVVNSALMRAVRKSSARYEAKECYLPEILLIVDAFQQGFKTLAPALGARTRKEPRVILGTVKGDFHEIGKDLVKVVLETNGITVLDLGVDVGASRFVEAQKNSGAPIVGLSAFITSARKQLAEIVGAFKDGGLSGVSVLVGGAAVNHQIAERIGAHGYGRDAIHCLKMVKSILHHAAHGR